MPLPIEDYALIGDTQTAALVGVDGSIDWLCLPRFDSPACFAALLGRPEHGYWRIAPTGGIRRTRRRYRGPSLVLETEFETGDGCVRVVDCMPLRRRDPDVARVVEGVRGAVKMKMELLVTFDYGSIVPWVRVEQGITKIVGGPDSLYLWTDLECTHVGRVVSAEFTVREGDQVPFLLLWHPSYEPVPDRVDPVEALDATESWWREWAGGCTDAGVWQDAVTRSLVTLKALTYAPSGGIVAAATTSLPEKLGGVRNWDYRFAWLRDATFTLYALVSAGYTQEAAAWRDWLMRAVAGDPGQLQIMYGCAGERRLTEIELDWLPGYEGSAPVRIGNAAADQTQLDVYGELMDAMYVARRAGLEPHGDAWSLQRSLLDFLEDGWRQADEGIWEVRGERRHFTHSKVLAWVAFDRAVKGVQHFGLEGPVDRWRSLRDRIHAEVCRESWDDERGTFTQSYGSRELDASLLQLPLVGFLPPDDPRVASTVAAIERELVEDGFVRRYPQEGCTAVDGLPPGEGTFLACTFWLADCQALLGRTEDAQATFERVLAVRNDVGLLAEMYDTSRGRMVGNFPQAFSHVGLVNTALNLSRVRGPAKEREEG